MSLSLPINTSEVHSVVVQKETKRSFIVPIGILEAEQVLRSSSKVDSAMTSAVMSFLSEVANDYECFRDHDKMDKPTDSMKAAVQERTEERLGKAYKWQGSAASYKSTILNCLANNVPLKETEGSQAGLYYGMETLRKMLQEAKGNKAKDYTKRVTALAKCTEDADAIAGVSAASADDWQRVIALACEAYGPSFVSKVADSYRAESINVPVAE